MTQIPTTVANAAPSERRRGELSGSRRAARRLVIGGHVQGLGVRPAIYRLATHLGLGGTVQNTPRGVEIELEGPVDDLDQFQRMLPHELPKGACPAGASEPLEPSGRRQFTIVKQPLDGPLVACIPEDRGLCAKCAEEIRRPGDRRHRYSFTSCTQCGPRYTVIRKMPFEREDSTMAGFPLCPDCRHEYELPSDRRFHAQTIACPSCGPRLWTFAGGENQSQYGDQAIRMAVACLRAGKVVALRGLGGYQLLVDATSQAAVDRLRARKGRRSKPLAVMVQSLEAAEKIAYFDHDEAQAFADPSAPVVLAKTRGVTELAPGIHPQLDTVGLMRPTTALHAILAADFDRPLVCTSGNREGDPLVCETSSAERQLAGIADLWLHHDRDITRPIDDSVVRVINGRRVSMRLARGLAPLALQLPAMAPTLAVGGYLKSAVAWSNGAQAVLGPHIGDQQSLLTRERFLAHLEDWQSLYNFRPALIVHDMHPDYFSTQWALAQAVPTLAVQHHHAHVVAAMLEHGWLDRTVLGVSWDGTGYGPDGTVWGGEFLVSTAGSYQRVARLRPFRLPGGDAAIREPWRVATSICAQLQAVMPTELARHWGLEPDRITSMMQIAQRPSLSPLTSSAGRLFDAAAALILGTTSVDFDGQAAMQLEAIADRSATGHYSLPLCDRSVAELDWRLLFAQLLAELRRGVDPGTISMRFHRGLARGIARTCLNRPDLPVVLCGGVFQNQLLTELIAEIWEDLPQQLKTPGMIPPNDGGLAAGQLAVAAARGGQLLCA